MSGRRSHSPREFPSRHENFRGRSPAVPFFGWLQLRLEAAFRPFPALVAAAMLLAVYGTADGHDHHTAAGSFGAAVLFSGYVGAVVIVAMLGLLSIAAWRAHRRTLVRHRVGRRV